MSGLLRRHVLTGVLAAAIPSWAWSAACVLPPPDADRVVLTLDIVNADVASALPLLTIHADGGVAVRLNDAARRARLSAPEMRELFAYILEAQAALSIDSAEIREAIGPMRRRLLADAPTSFLTLALPGCAHEVTVFGSAAFSGIAPPIDPLVRFRRIELRLLDIVTQVQARG